MSRKKCIAPLLVMRLHAKTFLPKIVLDVLAPLILRAQIVLLLFLTLFVAACGKKTNARSLPPPPPRPAPLGSVESGIASWYGEPYHGRAAANGEIFDMHSFTAAHRTLPFETWVRVENLSNGKSVEVRITDRGPFVEGRVIDLSRRAAQSIAMLGPGLAKVKLTVIPAPPNFAATLYAVQLGAFSDRSAADDLLARLPASFSPRSTLCESNAPPLCRVLVGRLPRAEALALRAQLKQAGFAGFLFRLAPPSPPANGGALSP